MSERWACRLVNQPRGTQRYQPTRQEDDDQLTQAIIELARQYARYGYRRTTALLQHAGWRVGKDLRQWLVNTGAKTLYIDPGSPWENGYCESFKSKLCDEFLNGEIFYSMKELRVLVER